MATTPEYDQWVKDPNPGNMALVLNSMSPIINSEIQRYTGPKPLLRSRARALAVKAIKTYDPASSAQLHSWVVTQIQPLSRYGQHLRTVHAPEVAIRQAAELSRHTQELSDTLGYEPSEEELADRVGISVQRIRAVRKMVRPSISEGSMQEMGESDEGIALPAVSMENKMPVVEEVVYGSLSPRDRAIFDWKVGRNGKTTISNQEIAKRLGVTPALISQRSQQIAQQIQELHQRNIL